MYQGYQQQPSGLSTSDIVHKGFLLKKKKSNTGWKKSAFMVTKNGLSYEKKNGQQVSFNKQDIAIIEELPGTFFKIHLTSKVLELSGIKVEEKKQWIDKIKSIAPNARFIQQTKQEELSRVKQKPTKRSSLLSSFTLRQQKKVNEIEELQHIESTIRSFNVTLANKNIEELTSIVQSAEAISFVALQLCRNANRSLMKLGVPIEKLPGKTKDSLLGGGTNNHMSSQTALKKMPNLAQQSPLAKPLSSLAPPQKPSLSIPAAQSPTSSDDNIEDIFSIMDKQAGLLGAGSSNDVDKINSFEDFANETQFLNDLPDMVEINAISNIAANTIPSSQAPRAQPKFAQPPPPQFMPRPPTQPRPFGTQQPSLPSVPPSQSYGKTAQRMCLLQTPPQPPQHPHLPPAPMQPPMQQPYQQNALSYEDSLYM